MIYDKLFTDKLTIFNLKIGFTSSFSTFKDTLPNCYFDSNSTYYHVTIIRAIIVPCYYGKSKRLLKPERLTL